MAKVILGQRPKSFPRTVTFPMHDGTTGTIECTFKYRTRSEFGAFIDKMTGAARAAASVDVPDHTSVDFSMADVMARTAGANAQYIIEVLDAWSLDEPLNINTAEQLADELPAAAVAIMETYRLAIVEGRLGN